MKKQVSIKECKGYSGKKTAKMDVGLFYFPNTEKKRILLIHEEDMKLIPVMDPKINERIKAQFENSGDSSKSLTEGSDDISGYLI